MRKAAKKTWAAALAGLLLALSLSACTQTTDDIDGGVRINNDFDAPKTIASTQIVSFSCEFSTLTLMEESTLGNDVFSLEATLDGDAVTVRFESRRTEKQTCAADEDFMHQLQQIVTRYDLAQYNGMDYFVSGLPDPFGARLQVTYDSDEVIYASDNQECFLPLAAMEELWELFSGQNGTEME